MDPKTVEIDVGAVEEEINDAEDSISDTEGDVSEEPQVLVVQLKKVMTEGIAGYSIMFKKKVKKVLKVQTNRVNEEIKYLKGKSITERNNLIRAASVGVAERIGLKKAEHTWKHRIEGDIKRLNQEFNFLEKEVRGELRLKKKHKLSE